ncbi:hypothetical protein FPSE_09670 [Fusarium pseudograminearum CS3096]|uniref:Uncharacterized protein n=1 Tax=Fusarium pseudograminearum (strain CS3096) TaxID=1028729 RepID=K3V9N7_FUSPC|nr:hypothetical protein FPSE_09670 [Fusarium pseudograminearum CS3096]EKJ70144.1 hypothetical protein FPSE_09670 [Fusarium pseudograminearum CS3096]
MSITRRAQQATSPWCDSTPVPRLSLPVSQINTVNSSHTPNHMAVDNKLSAPANIDRNIC